MGVTRALILLQLLGLALGKTVILEDLVVAPNGFEYLTKFCFSTIGGLFKFEVDYDPNLARNRNLLIALYSDSESQWGLVEPRLPKSKEGKMDYKTLTADNCGADFMTPAANAHGLQQMIDGFEVLTSSMRPRYWFVALINCNPNDVNQRNITDYAVNIGSVKRIKITMMQEMSLGGVSLNTHWGQDQHGMFFMSIAFFVAFVVFCGFTAFTKKKAKIMERQYQVIKMVFISVFFAMMGNFCVMVDFATFAEDGVGLVHAADFAFFFELFSDIQLMSILFDLSQGWTISTNHVAGQRLKWGLLLVYFVVNCLLISFSYRFTPEYSTTYIYESAPGILILVVRVLMLAWFLRCLRETIGYEDSPRKIAFYRVFGLFGVLIFLSIPVCVLVGIELQPWWRPKTMMGLVFVTRTLSFVLLYWLFFPTETNRFNGDMVLDPKRSVAFGNNQLQIFPEQAADFTDI
jgi:hypothetical protein